MRNSPRFISCEQSGGCGDWLIDRGRRDAYALSMAMRFAKYAIGQVVKHRIYPFRGVIFDVDPTFANSEEWWLSIPAEARPAKDQPFYRLYAENEDSQYIAYVSEQNLLPDESGEPVSHPEIGETFDRGADGRYLFRRKLAS
jgi:heat shock protein HspQ